MKVVLLGGTKGIGRALARLIAEHRLLEKPYGLLFSTIFGKLTTKELAEWIIADRLPVRFQLQMHKYIWDPNERGV